MKALMTVTASLLFLFGQAYAATESVSLIRQNCSGYTNCYTSLSDWQAAYGGIPGGDLISADKIAVARIEGAWSQPDTKLLSLNYWKTNSGHYVKIYTAADARHKGVAGNGYCLMPASGYPIYSNIAYLRIEGLQVRSTTASTALYVQSQSSADGDGDVRIAYNIVSGNGVDTGYGIYVSSPGVTRIYNNVVYDAGQPGYTAAIGTSRGRHYVYNNTIGSTISGFGIRSGGAGAVTIAKNNLIKSAGSCFYDLFANGSDFNACSNNVVNNSINTPGSGGPHDTASQQFVFVNEGGKDFHLSQLDTAAHDKGANLSGDPALPLTDDIDGQARYGAFDIGADEYSTGSIPTDTTAPSIPQGLKIDSATSEQVDLSWSASTDASGVAGYNIYRNDILIAGVSTNRFTDTTVAPLLDYVYAVSAFDASHNESQLSATQALTVPKPVDTDSPRQLIISVKMLALDTASISWATDEPATTQVVYGASGSYTMATVKDTALAVWHSVSLPSLIIGTTYTFRVKSADALGNEAVSGEFTFTVKPVLGKTYYVDNQHPQASDANGGTAGLPWKTIQHAVDSVSAGDTVIVMPGSYERFRVKKGGEPGYYITIKGVNPPDKSHINFSELFDPKSPKQFPGAPSRNAVCRGFSLSQDYTSKVPLRYIRIENFEITAIYKAGLPFPGRGGIHLAGRVETGTNAPVEYVEVVGNFLHDMNPDPPGYDYIAIRGDSHFTNNILVKNNTIFRCQGTGINLMGNDWLVESNDVSHTLDANTDTGLQVGGDSDACRFFGTGHIIRNNYFHECLDTEQFGSPHIDSFQVFSVYPDTQFADHILVEGNYIYDMGQFLMSEDSAEGSGVRNAVHHVTFRNNVFRKCRAQGIIVGIDHFTFVNNIITETTYAGLSMASSLAYHGVILNNIFYNNSAGSSVSSIGAKVGTVCDYNIHFPDFGSWPPKPPEFEKHGSFGVDPKLLNPLSGDYRLTAGSPAIDKGISWPGIITDKDGIHRPQGQGWDIGPYEYGAVSISFGDVSENGVVSAYDASLTAQYSVNLITLTSSQLAKADVSGNGSVTSYDASLIAQYAVGLITKFPVEG